jgi:hypothetical protein
MPQGANPKSTEFAERLMYISGGLAIAAGLLAWLTTPATVYWLAVELAVGALWVGAARALRSGRSSARIAATVLCVISIPLAGVMLILLTLFAASWPGAIVMLCDVIRLALPVLVIVLLWTPGSRRGVPRGRQQPGRPAVSVTQQAPLDG